MRLVLATATAFEPPCEGDRIRIHNLVHYMRARGWQVFVVHLHDPVQTDSDYAAMREKCDGLWVYRAHESERPRSTDESPDSWCPAGFARLFGNVCRELQPDAAMAQFVFLSRCLTELPGDGSVVRILDADNAFAGRRELFEAAGIPYDWFSTSEAEERNALLRADLVAAIQEPERRRLVELGAGVRVCLLPHLCESVSTPLPQRPAVAFLGAGSPENAAGLRPFIAQALPLLRARHPHAELLVAGGIARRLGPLPAGVRALGIVPDVSEVYAQAPIAVNPARTGTGLKIKSVDALRHGRCLVTTAAGAQGFEDHPEVYVSANSPEDFALRISELLDDFQRVARIAEAARRFAEARFAPDRVLAAFEAHIADLRHRNPSSRPGARARVHDPEVNRAGAAAPGTPVR